MPLSPKVIAITENLDFASTSKHSLICPIKDSNCVLVCLNPPQPSVAFHIKTGTGFYMKCNLRLRWVTWIKNMMKVNNKNRRTKRDIYSKNDVNLMLTVNLEILSYIGTKIHGECLELQYLQQWLILRQPFCEETLF